MQTITKTLILTALAAGAAMAADPKAGQATYEKSCKTCHGLDGTPNPAIVKMMKVEMSPLKSSAVQSKSDADLKKLILEGQGKMKPIAIPAASAEDVVAYLRTFAK